MCCDLNIIQYVPVLPNAPSVCMFVCTREKLNLMEKIRRELGVQGRREHREGLGERKEERKRGR